MEAAGFSASVVPLVVDAVKSYRAVHQYLRVFRHSTPEIKRLSTRLEVQQCILEKELDFILQRAVPRGPQAPTPSAAELLAQYDSSGSVRKTSNVDNALRQLLCRHTDTFTGLLRGIAEQLRELQTELRCFDAIRSEQTQGESMKQTISRVKAKIKIGFDKRRLGDLLDGLRNDIEDLRALASYLADEPKTSSYRSSVNAMPAEVMRNRAVILVLHESLTSCWTCIDPGHGGHVAKLCLDAMQVKSGQQSPEVRLDLAVACLPGDATNLQQSVVPISTWLYVRTTTELPCAAPSGNVEQRRGTYTAAFGANGQALTKHGAVCESLVNRQRNSKGDEACLSYLQPTSGLRHTFYHDCNSPPEPHDPMRSKSLEELVPDIRMELTIEQQLKLARRLVLSVLELYKTPWLPEQWRSSDLSSFATPSTEDDAFVRRLHVTSTISGPQHPGQAAIDSHWAIASLNQSLHGALPCMIDNSTLFSLGVALLEIAHSKPLEHFRLDEDNNLLATAQRLLQRGCPLGDKYRELARQCLRCDLGCGNELEARGLQDAVYADVIGQLDNLMSALSV